MGLVGSVVERRLPPVHRGPGARRVVATILAALLIPAPAFGRPFRLGEVRGIFDLTLGYGLVARTEGTDDRHVGIANGGSAPSVNFDDGTLNYDTGLVSNGMRATGELTLAWRNIGAVVRGFGFYDFETMLNDRRRTDLSNDAEDLIGWDGELREYYLSIRDSVLGMPVQMRVGDQVLNWGEGGLLRFDVDIVNPFDFVALFQPTTLARDVRLPQGMLWGVLHVTESVALEAFYQYDWEPARRAPIGGFFSADDLVGGDDELGFAMAGLGQFSDQGTDLDAAFGLPKGTLGFDRRFQRIPAGGLDEPSDQGQYGITLQTFLTSLNASKVALHFVNYHSRLPLVNGRTAGRAALAATSDQAVQARAAALANQTGLPIEQTRPIAEALTVSDVSNQTRYSVSYPENIKMLGLSFNTATVRTGTLLSGEVSHHFDWPVQVLREEVLAAALSPIEFTDDFAKTSLGRFGPNQFVKGYERTGKTELSLGVAQLLGPRLGASRSAVGLDVGWVHGHDLPSGQPVDADSWGYRLLGQLTYTSLLGGITARPGFVWTHDVDGTTAGPSPPFVEDRKSITAFVGLEWANTITSSFSYTNFFGGEPVNVLGDRDFVRFNLMFHY